MNTQNDLPPGIEAEIYRPRKKDDQVGMPAGVVRETYTEYGRSVHLAHGTHYEIRITNTTNKHIAVNLCIDGRKVNLTPILVYREVLEPGDDRAMLRGRKIKGFDLTRNSVELEDDEFETTSTYEPFVVKQLLSDFAASATTDHRIGAIEFELFATRYAPRQPGRTQQRTAPNHTPSTQHNARMGVMATGSVATFKRRVASISRESKRAAKGRWLISKRNSIRRAT